VIGVGGFFAALTAGVVSFLSPCVLPLVPGYVSFLAGTSVQSKRGAGHGTSTVLAAALFVLGFTAVFVALGSTASLAGSLLSPYRGLLGRLSGVLIVVFGVIMLGVVRLPWLYGEARMDPARARSLGGWAAPTMGAAFAFGWTPCVGPVLGSILVLAGSSAGVGRGAALLLVYSLGLGVPFLLVAALLDRLGGTLHWLERHALVVQRVAGALLIAFGVVMALGMLPWMAGWLGRLVPEWGL
jgi:cytochrome c-type biogenesis protein